MSVPSIQESARNNNQNTIQTGLGITGTATQHHANAKRTEKESELMHVYSKRINEITIIESKILKKSDRENISQVVDSLMGIGKHRKLDYFDLNTNCKIWIREILSSYCENLEIKIEYILNDFTDCMKTRMREEDKYVLAIISSDLLIICHSRGRENTITPGWKVVQRMLDRDNVDRFVSFKKEGESIGVYYYEHYPSDSFIEWLGIPEKEAFYYMGGRNRIYTVIEGMKCAMELSDEDVENLLINKKCDFKIEKDRLYLSNPIRMLHVGQIRVGKKIYKTMDDFLQVYLARRYNLANYTRKYQELISSFEPMTSQFIDNTDNIAKIDSNVEQISLYKKNPNIYILFASKLKYGCTIQLQDSFFTEIYAKFSNNNLVRIFHAGMKLYSSGEEHFRIGSMEFFNKLNLNDLIIKLSKIYNSISLRDNILDRSLCYALFYILNDKNRNAPISLFLEKVLDQLSNEIKSCDKISENESKIIEFKSRDFVVGKNEDIAKKFSFDIGKKLKLNPFRIYIIGINETTQEIEPLTNNIYPSERLTVLENCIRRELNDNVDIYIVKVPLTNGCLLELIVRIN